MTCITDKFLIGPDNMIYPCHRHLYAGDRRYTCGSQEDIAMRAFKFEGDRIRRRWMLPCNTKGNPCDFGSAKIKPMGKPAHAARAS